MSDSDYIQVDQKDGPILVPMELPVGDPTPIEAIQKAVTIASEVLNKDKKCKIAILSHLIKNDRCFTSGSRTSIGQYQQYIS